MARIRHAYANKNDQKIDRKNSKNYCPVFPLGYLHQKSYFFGVVSGGLRLIRCAISFRLSMPDILTDSSLESEC